MNLWAGSAQSHGEHRNLRPWLTPCPLLRKRMRIDWKEDQRSLSIRMSFHLDFTHTLLRTTLIRSSTWFTKSWLIPQIRQLCSPSSKSRHLNLYSYYLYIWGFLHFCNNKHFWFCYETFRGAFVNSGNYLVCLFNPYLRLNWVLLRDEDKIKQPRESRRNWASLLDVLHGGALFANWIHSGWSAAERLQTPSLSRPQVVPTDRYPSRRVKSSSLLLPSILNPLLPFLFFFFRRTTPSPSITNKQEMPSSRGDSSLFLPCHVRLSVLLPLDLFPLASSCHYDPESLGIPLRPGHVITSVFLPRFGDVSFKLVFILVRDLWRTNSLQILRAERDEFDVIVSKLLFDLNERYPAIARLEDFSFDEGKLKKKTAPVCLVYTLTLHFLRRNALIDNMPPSADTSLFNVNSIWEVILMIFNKWINLKWSD